MTPSMPSTPSNSTAFRRLWLAVFLVAFPLGIIAFVLPIYGRELGASAVEVGAFFSAFSIVPVIVRPFLGRALDRWGRRPFLLLGLGGYSVAMAIFCFADTILLLTLARFIQGLGQAFLWLSAYTMVADLASERGRGRDFGSIDESANFGALVGTAGGFGVMFVLGQAGLSLTQSWPWIFLLYAIPAIAALAIGWRGVPETRPRSDTGPVRGRPISAQLLALMGIVVFTGASNAMVWPLLMIFLQDSLGAGIASLAFAYLPAAVLSSFLPSRLGRYADRFGRKPLMVVGLVGGAFATAVIPHLRSLLALTAVWAVESVGYAASLPAERAFVADIAGEDTRGTSYGLYTFAYFLGSLVGPVGGGWLYDNLGHAMPFYLNTAVLLGGALLVVLVLRETRRGIAPSEAII